MGILFSVCFSCEMELVEDGKVFVEFIMVLNWSLEFLVIVVILDVVGK